jgi:Pectate lyase superfamily protein
MSYPGRSRLAINVQDFGAVADSDQHGGGTDASVAINNAIQSQAPGTNSNVGGSEIFLPDGFYRLSHPIHVSKGMTLRGSCAGNPVSGAVLVPDVGVQGIVIDFGDTFALGLYQDGSPLSVNAPVASASLGAVLPGITSLEVTSADGFTPSGELLVLTDIGFKVLTYTGISSGNTFTGLPPSTAVAAGSDGLNIADVTVLNVTSNVGFPTAGLAFVETDSGLQKFLYSGVSGTTQFTGIQALAGASGIMHTGNSVSTTAAIGTLVAGAVVVQGTPQADGAWCVVKDLCVYPAGKPSYPEWTPDTLVSPGDVVSQSGVVAPYPTSYTGWAFRAVVGGTTGGTEPDWASIQFPAAALEQLTITDGGVTWQIIEYGHAIRLYEFAKIENVYCSNAGGDGIRVHADVTDSDVPTGANIFRIDYSRMEGCLGYALFVAGGDSNAGLVTRLSGASNSGGGIFDNSFLGNTYVECHMADNYPSLNDYIGINGNATGLFCGCYSEGGNWIVNSPWMIIQPTGWKQTTTGVPAQLIKTGSSSPLTVTAIGTGTMLSQLGEVNQETVLYWLNQGVEPLPWRFHYSDPGSGASSMPIYLVDIGLDLSEIAISFTGENHRESGAYVQAQRGIMVGPLAGVGDLDSGPLLTNGTAAPSGVVSELNNQWRVGDEVLNTTPQVNGIEKWVCDVRGGFTNTEWTADAHHYGGDLIEPTPAQANGYVYRAIGTGLSGSVEPTWTTVIGATFADGEIFWECFGVDTPLFTPVLILGPRVRHNMTSDANYTLTTQESFASIVEISDTGGVLTTTRTIFLPLWDGAQRTVNNQTAQSLAFESSTGTGPTVVSGVKSIIYCDGTNWVTVV